MKVASCALLSYASVRRLQQDHNYIVSIQTKVTKAWFCLSQTFKIFPCTTDTLALFFVVVVLHILRPIPIDHSSNFIHFVC